MRIAFLAAMLGAISNAADPADGGPADPNRLGGLMMNVSGVAFDGQNVTARIQLETTADTLIDTRFNELALVWPTKAVTCDGGVRLPFQVGLRIWHPPGQGQELLMKPGDRFERTVSMELYSKPKDIDCIDLVVTLHVPTSPGPNPKGSIRQLASVKVRAIRAPNQPR